MKTTICAVAAAGSLLVALAAPAHAQVRDGVYRGTLVCTKVPGVVQVMRSAIEVTIAGNTAKYTHPVRSSDHGTALGTESGSGSVDGQAIKLGGSWRGDKASYDAVYSGTFVRRSAKLSGTQTWTRDGKTYTSSCSGAIKRPLALFMRKDAR